MKKKSKNIKEEKGNKNKRNRNKKTQGNHKQINLIFRSEEVATCQATAFKLV